MAKRYERFTKPYEHSKIPFLLAEVVTNGKGEMVDLICRFANQPAADLLGTSPAALCNQRFCQAVAPDRLSELTPLCQVAFSGSSQSFICETVTGHRLQITCYQLMYGLCACILEEGQAKTIGSHSLVDLLTDSLPGGTAVIELGKGSMRGLSFSRQVSELAGYPYRELLNRFSADLSPLICPDDRLGLVQCLMDAASSDQPVCHEFRLLRRDKSLLWVTMHAKRISINGPTSVFQAVLLNIDSQKRGEELLRMVQQNLSESMAHLDYLLDSIPGGGCLFRLPADGGTPQLLRVSQGFSKLLGFPRADLLKKMGSDPLWRIHPDDRADFLAAQDAVLSGRLSPHNTFRFQRKDGTYLWLSLSLASQAQEDGGVWIYTVYTDVTREKGIQKELQFYSELSDLFLERAGSISIDYDPCSDTARFVTLNVGGQQLVRTIPDYQKTLLVSATIHPDFRDAVLAELHAACKKPKKGTFSYLGNYGGQDFRWYQASFVSLTDHLGNVCRVIIKSEDISEREAAAVRFRDQMTRWESAGKEILCSIRLDLSENKPLDARSDNPYLLRTMFGNSADDCISGIQQNIPEEENRIRFGASFSRESLLKAFQGGTFHFGLEHRFLTGPKSAVWVRSMGELVENPENRHVEINLFLLDTDFQKCRSIIMDRLAEQVFYLIMTVDVSSRRFRRYDGNQTTAGSCGDFYKAALELIEKRALPQDRKHLRSVVLIPNLIKYLKKTDLYSTVIPLQSPNGTLCYEQFSCSWLDEEKRALLITGFDLTQLAESQQRREQELSKTLKEVQERESAKGRFLTRLSHEIRTPVGMIQKMASQLLQSPEDPSRTAACLEKIQTSSRYLQALTSDILDLNRMENGQISLQNTEFFLPGLIKDLQQLFAVLSSGKTLQYTCKTAPELASCYIGDSIKLKQILLNLLSNAVRFTPDGGKISLEIFPGSGGAVTTGIQFVVSDTGCGIPTKLLPSLFEPFIHSGSAATNSTGLGLAICKSLVTQMGGTIAVNSIAEVGTRFTVTLPLDIAAGSQPPASPNFSGRRILLGFSAAPDIDALPQHLQALGCMADCLPDGLRVLQQFATQPVGRYDAVLLDLELPVMNGLQTAAGIRGWNKADAKSIPIFAIGDPELKFDALHDSSAGITAWLDRPLGPDALLETLSSYLIREK